MGLSIELADDRFIVEVPDAFVEYIDAAIVRLGYLMPELQLIACDGSVRSDRVEIDKADQIRREVLHTIYREKIYAETLGLRQALLQTLVK